MRAPRHNIPTVFAAFGATGDLMRLKVLPALYHLHTEGALPEMFRVVGFSRRPWGDDEFRVFVREIVGAGATNSESLDSFVEMFSFQSGDFDAAESFDALKQKIDGMDREWGMCASKLFYLSVAPEFYTTIAGHLSRSGLSDPCGPDEGWTRIVVEKPFGSDMDSARAIDERLAALFTEDQIYRIDHYLGKEMLQNILTFRFSNNLFEIPWGNELIERIDIRLHESIGAEKRGTFYDATGTLRDVGQNHLLQIVALLTMEHPQSFAAQSIRANRARALQAVDVPTEEDVRAHSFRAQYDGFRAIPGVAPDSETETYFNVRATINTPKWRGVPIYMESGKRLGEALKEILITFKHPSPCLCPTGTHHKNGVIIRLEPKEEILIEFWSKKPGLTMETERRDFHFLLRERTHVSQYTEEYKKLLLDCIRGDQTLFISTDEIVAMWRYIDPIVAEWKKGTVPLHAYTPDTKDILQQSAR